MNALPEITSEQKAEIYDLFAHSGAEFIFMSTEHEYYVTLLTKDGYPAFKQNASWLTVGDILKTTNATQNYKLYDQCDKLYVLEYIFG